MATTLEQRLHLNVSKRIYNSIKSFIKSDDHNKAIDEYANHYIFMIFKHGHLFVVHDERHLLEFACYVISKKECNFAVEIVNDCITSYSSYFPYSYTEMINALLTSTTTHNNMIVLKHLLDNYLDYVDFGGIEYFGGYQSIKLLLEADEKKHINIERLISHVLRGNHHACFDLVLNSASNYNIVDMSKIIAENICTTNPRTIMYLEKRFPELFNDKSEGELDLYEQMFKNYYFVENHKLTLYLLTKIDQKLHIDSSSKIYRFFGKLKYDKKEIKKFFKEMFVNAGIRLKAHPSDNFEFSINDLIMVLSIVRKEHTAETIKKVISKLVIKTPSSHEIYELLCCHFSEKLEDIKDSILKIVNKNIQRCHVSEIFNTACHYNNVDVVKYIISYSNKNSYNIIMEYTCCENCDDDIICSYRFNDNVLNVQKNENKYINYFLSNENDYSI